MRKSSNYLAAALVFWLLRSCYPGPDALLGADNPSLAYSALAEAQLTRARNEMERIRGLVSAGVLPKSWLDDAEVKLADAEDQQTITRVFYGKPRVQDLTEQEASELLAAAGRRVDRQTQLVANQQQLVEQGVLARVEVEAVERELESRKRTLSIAKDRVKLMRDLREMASAEARLENQATAASLRGAMIRYDGSGLFRLDDLPAISQAFERRFHRALPVSATGETALHQSMGLDHRGRVDVALSPEGQEGVWLRRYLERARIPYLAFRSAVPGAATAPHIHIGTGSSRLGLVQAARRGL